MRTSRETILPIFLFFLSSCTKLYVSADELQQYILHKENGLIKTVVNGSIEAELSYRPADLIVLQEVKSKGLDKPVHEIKSKYEDYAYFILRLARNDSEFLNEFARLEEKYPEALNYFTEGIKDDLLLSSARIKLTPDIVVLMQSFGISNYTDLLIAFRTRGLQEKDDIKITLSDSAFIPGFYEFSFKAKEIRCVPLLNPLSYEVI